MDKIVLNPGEIDLGGFYVRRALPNKHKMMIGPWIFFDHMGPANFVAGKGIDVRPHPHINLATVTYLFEGELFHRDSLGNAQAIKPGDINLMVAGKGIVHSERERPEIRNQAHTQHALQLWHALPEEYEEVDPAFYHYDALEMPKFEIDGVIIRVLMGNAYGHSSPVKTYSNILYVEAHLQPSQKLKFPEAEEIAFYTVYGELKLGEEIIPSHQFHMCLKNRPPVIEATQESRVVFIGGKPLGKRHIEWNFVSSRKERIEDAKKAWINKEFPIVPGDEKEFIPLPNEP